MKWRHTDDQPVAAGGPWERKYNNLFPWNHHAELLVTQGLVWKNYPDDVRWPGEEKTGGRNKAKGIAELSMPELDRMIEGLVDRDYPFEFERVDKEGEYLRVLLPVAASALITFLHSPEEEQAAGHHLRTPGTRRHVQAGAPLLRQRDKRPQGTPEA